MNTILSHKERSVNFTKKIGEVRAVNKIEANLPQFQVEKTYLPLKQ